MQNELILNHITTGENMPPFKKEFEDYQQVVHLYLNKTGKHLFESDIVNRYREGVTLESLFEQNPKRYIPGFMMVKDGIRQNTWYDTWGIDEITREQPFFDYFFIIKLRHLSLLDIDEHLTFHLDYSFKNNKQDYFRFLRLAMRQYEDKLNPNIIHTVNEWIEASQSNALNEGVRADGKEKKIRGRMHREAGDKLTCLNQAQTALLITFMQKAGMILKDDYLNYTQAGNAFHLLTGYSPDTIRQQLGTKGAIEGVKFEDYRELHEAVTRLAALIEAETRKNK